MSFDSYKFIFMCWCNQNYATGYKHVLKRKELSQIENFADDQFLKVLWIWTFTEKLKNPETVKVSVRVSFFH